MTIHPATAADISGGCVVLDRSHAYGHDHLLYHLAPAVRLALEHQVRYRGRRFAADLARELSLLRAVHLDRRDPQRPPVSTLQAIAAVRTATYTWPVDQSDPVTCRKIHPAVSLNGHTIFALVCTPLPDLV